MQPHLTFVHISDTHLGPSPDFVFNGRRPYACLERLVAILNGFPRQPDFVLHSGDVSDDRSPASYELAADLLNRLTAPIFYVNGNHDDRALMNRMLHSPLHASGDPARPLDYVFERQGERFMVLDVYSTEVPDPAGQISAEQLAWVRAEANQVSGPPLTVLLHYPSLRMASPWLDRHMLIANGEELHAALLPARPRLRGVFFGHLHRSCQIARDGITYTCAPSATAQYAWRLWDEKPQLDPDSAPSYNLVLYARDQVVVHQYTFGCP